jgi:hypothetical protein
MPFTAHVHIGPDSPGLILEGRLLPSLFFCPFHGVRASDVRLQNCAPTRRATIARRAARRQSASGFRCALNRVAQVAV